MISISPTKSTTEADSSRRNKGIVVCVFLAIGIGGFLLLSRRQKTTGKPLLLQQPSGLSKESLPAHIRITALPSEDTKQMASKGMLHYKNKEIRSIEWNSEGLPSKVIIEREYYQLP